MQCAHAGAGPAGPLRPGRLVKRMADSTWLAQVGHSALLEAVPPSAWLEGFRTTETRRRLLMLAMGELDEAP